MSRVIIKFSKEKLAKKDPYEIIRFAYHTNLKNLNRFLIRYNVKINDIADIKRLVEGKNKMSLINGYSNSYLINNFYLDKKELKHNYSKKNILIL